MTDNVIMTNCIYTQFCSYNYIRTIKNNDMKKQKIPNTCTHTCTYRNISVYTKVRSDITLCICRSARPQRAGFSDDRKLLVFDADPDSLDLVLLALLLVPKLLAAIRNQVHQVIDNNSSKITSNFL